MLRRFPFTFEVVPHYHTLGLSLSTPGLVSNVLIVKHFLLAKEKMIRLGMSRMCISKL